MKQIYPKLRGFVDAQFLFIFARCVTICFLGKRKEKEHDWIIRVFITGSISIQLQWSCATVSKLNRI
jgi:hypothetical protein